MRSKKFQNQKFTSGPALNLSKGFTLIELMVSVSIFIIVAFIVTGTFIIAMDAYRKAQQIRLVIDNVNYAMDAMVLEIREGTNYKSISPDSFRLENLERPSQTITYAFQNNAICRRIGSGDCLPLTDPNVATIKSLNFRVFSTDSAGARPPMAQINVYGQVKIGKTSSDFNLQTTVTQRNPDVGP